MTTLTVTAKGQITLRKELLQYLGVQPGQKIEVNELPGGRIEVSAARTKGTIDDFIGLFEGRSGKVASLDEINDAAARGWSDQE